METTEKNMEHGEHFNESIVNEVILEDMKYKDVADSLGISVNTVKSLKKSAYTSLRGQLKDPMLFLLFLLIDS